MGGVYCLRDTRLDRTVAVKALPPPQSASPEAPKPSRRRRAHGATRPRGAASTFRRRQPQRDCAPTGPAAAAGRALRRVAPSRSAALPRWPRPRAAGRRPTRTLRRCEGGTLPARPARTPRTRVAGWPPRTHPFASCAPFRLPRGSGAGAPPDRKCAPRSGHSFHRPSDRGRQSIPCHGAPPRWPDGVPPWSAHPLDVLKGDPDPPRAQRIADRSLSSVCGRRLLHIRPPSWIRTAQRT